MSNMFIYGFRFSMLGLADVPTPSQTYFPTGRALVLVLCQIKTGIRIMIDFLLEMGAQCWVPFLLCHPSDAPLLEAVGFSLEIIIFVG